MRIAVFVLSTFLSFGTANASSIGASTPGMFKPDDGTYKTVNVRSPEACNKLCKKDKKCRGAVTFQADITKKDMVCRLNDGFGQNAVFPQVAPEPLDLQTAVRDLNNYRAQYGLKPVRLSERLNAASQVHAADLAQAGIASHTGTDGSSHADRATRQGYKFSLVGENVATGQKSWAKVFKAWQDSPGHNENLLQPDVTDFGIALVYEPTTTYSTYWAMLVGTPLKPVKYSELRFETQAAP